MAMDRDKERRLAKEGSKPSVGVSQSGQDLQREGLERGKIDTSRTVQGGETPIETGRARPLREAPLHEASAEGRKAARSAMSDREEPRHPERPGRVHD